MYLVMNHIPTGSPEAAATIEARFAQRSRLVDAMPGFRSFELLRPLPGGPHGAPRGTEHLVLTRGTTARRSRRGRTARNVVGHTAMPGSRRRRQRRRLVAPG